MKRTYEVTERADKRAIREFLKREGQPSGGQEYYRNLSAPAELVALN